ncbi:MAG TPA: hypothetical protein VN759_08875, partial [Pseudolysinimonas sp.]|nr:hypothetical protein [Pseudolysinimonas sp.]
DLTDAPQAGSAASGSGRSNPAGIVLLVLAAVLVLVLATPVTVRRAIRRSRLRAMERGRDPAAAAWAEVRDTARDHGWAAPESETAREFATRLKIGLGDGSGADGAGIDGLRSSVEHSAYAEVPAVISVAQLRAVLRAIEHSVSGRDRLRAVLLPPSLVARIRGPEG